MGENRCLGAYPRKYFRVTLSNRSENAILQGMEYGKTLSDCIPIYDFSPLYADKTTRCQMSKILGAHLKVRSILRSYTVHN